MAGISRSATIVTAYLMRSCSMTAKDALAQLKKVRPIVRPNNGFFTQLKIYYDVGFEVNEKHVEYRRFLMTKMADWKSE